MSEVAYKRYLIEGDSATARSSAQDLIGFARGEKPAAAFAPADVETEPPPPETPNVTRILQTAVARDLRHSLRRRNALQGRALDLEVYSMSRLYLATT